MALLRGQTIILYNREQTGTDAFNAPVFRETAENVKNIMICPASTEAITDGLQLYGKHAVYELLIPKGDDHEWKDAVVEFFGEQFRTFGAPTQGIDHLIPLQWNAKVKVERYEP